MEIGKDWWVERWLVTLKRVKLRADYGRLPKVFGEYVKSYGLVAMIDV